MTAGMLKNDEQTFSAQARRWLRAGGLIALGMIPAALRLVAQDAILPDIPQGYIMGFAVLMLLWGVLVALEAKITRKRFLALFLVTLGVFMLFRSGDTLTDDIITTLTISADPGSPSLDVATLIYMRVVAAFYVVAGLLGLLNFSGQRIDNVSTPLDRLITALMFVGGALLIPTILIVAAAGGSTNVVTMLSETLRLATPLAIGAMAGLWCERAGVVNIAIEGMMLFGACFGFAAVYLLLPTASPDNIGWVMLAGVGVAILAGGLAALLHAWLSITFATDQIVSGTVINILAIGVTSFIRREVLLSTEASIARLPNVRIPFLADIPVVGEALFNNQPIFYAMFFVVIGTHIILFYSRWGLRVQSVGEEPAAADSLGINVNQVRWRNVFIGGLIAGLAGAWFSLEATGRFTNGMTRGAGFIALAALIFGKWTPAGAFAGALLFGFADALGTRFQIIGVDVPVQFLQMVPYVVTLIVLAGLVGRAFPPKAVGKPFKK